MRPRTLREKRLRLVKLMLEIASMDRGEYRKLLDEMHESARAAESN